MSSIDLVYDSVIENLVSQEKIKGVSSKLNSLTANDERVLYVYGVMESLNIFPNVKQVAKCEKVADDYRNQGNKCFQKKQDYEAWQYYNLSLLHAPLYSESYIVALANRSAVFYALKKYKKCLKDIELIFTMNYPPKVKEKLMSRKMQCQDILSTEKEDEKEDYNVTLALCLFGQRHPRYLCASRKLEVECTEKMGRHVVAKDDIKVGEVIVKEKPYFKLALRNQSLFTCAHCLSRSENLYPCENCCYVLYCSQECKQAAWNSYHSVECPMMATLIYQSFSKLELLSLRTAIKARTDHPDWTSLFKTIEVTESLVNSELRGHVEVEPGKWVYDSTHYASVHTLATNIEKRNISDIFQKCVTAAAFIHLLSNMTPFLKTDGVVSSQKIRETIAGLLLLHGMTSPTNMHNIDTNVQSKEGDFVDELCIGSAPYPFLSLLNHSCSPNVVRYSKLGTGTMVLLALRPIKKGQQLFDNYGCHHAVEDRKSRQEALKKQYKFTCMCEACVNNWPLFSHLKPAESMTSTLKEFKESLLNGDSMEQLQKGDKKTAIELYKPLCTLAELLESYAPCMELAECQECLKQCLSIFSGVTPYGYNREIQWDAIPSLS
ncbi:hypothetical protein JYU34_001751 [Plutella xylostella]|uniref:Protein-lysine N-methyltransferase SMYD4 n=2 Tax=Plutella xylostella TaxID=51655 RepID=A0A8S4E7I0_PLUXY|nr:hypothetical protein JYU34_001751 [Plutella xylostella]CAG9111621.1 unnamed protein product [Plutella xylostella]